MNQRREGTYHERNHIDCSIHIERACELHGAKMTQHGLLHKGLASAD